jgi:thiamine biosynthesis lipoprotein
MKDTRLVMGMPVTVEIIDPQVTQAHLDTIFDYFTYVDETFSTYKESSEISRINAGTLPSEQWSEDMCYILEQCEITKQETDGYFDISHNGKLDPSGYVKGWAIQNAAALASNMQFHHYYIEAGGDLQVAGNNNEHKPWVIGIRNPFNREQNIKRVSLENMGMATSGTYIRGDHIYNPKRPGESPKGIVSLTVIGPTVVDADRYATAAFAMGKEGIAYIAQCEGFEGYLINDQGIATFTPGFTTYVLP